MLSSARCSWHALYRLHAHMTSWIQSFEFNERALQVHWTTWLYERNAVCDEVRASKQISGICAWLLNYKEEHLSVSTYVFMHEAKALGIFSIASSPKCIHMWIIAAIVVDDWHCCFLMSVPRVTRRPSASLWWNEKKNPDLPNQARRSAQLLIKCALL